MVGSDSGLGYLLVSLIEGMSNFHFSGSFLCEKGVVEKGCRLERTNITQHIIFFIEHSSNTHTKSEYKKCLKKHKNIFWPAFGCRQHMNAGRNTQHNTIEL